MSLTHRRGRRADRPDPRHAALLRAGRADAAPRRPLDTGHRRYTEADLNWIGLINCLRGTGMPIREVRRYAELVRAGDGNETERLDLLRAHRLSVLAQLAEVTEHLGAIDRKIGIYTDKLEAIETRAEIGA